jgi:vacuolar-type H+-ATPase subunit D/Vma8
LNGLENRDALMEEYVRLMQNMLRSRSTLNKRAKSVYQSKNLGTIKDRKKQKQEQQTTTKKEDSNGEIILRILRMRYLFWSERWIEGTNYAR